MYSVSEVEGILAGELQKLKARGAITPTYEILPKDTNNQYSVVSGGRSRDISYNAVTAWQKLNDIFLGEELTSEQAYRLASQLEQKELEAIRLATEQQDREAKKQAKIDKIKGEIAKVRKDRNAILAELPERGNQDRLQWFFGLNKDQQANFMKVEGFNEKLEDLESELDLAQKVDDE